MTSLRLAGGRTFVEVAEPDPREGFFADAISIVDSNAPSRLRREPYVLIEGGETSKDAGAFLRLARTVRALPPSRAIVGVGGGAVLDVASTLAALLERGRLLRLVPTTPLAAVDAAVGGKTALNLDGVKNVLGTIYPASEVYVPIGILRETGDLLRQAAAEVAKLALLSGVIRAKRARRLLDAARLLAGRPREAIDLGDAVVDSLSAKDLFLGVDLRSPRREALNLGHTVGHVLEAGAGIPHGFAVGYGLRLAALWSFRRGFLPSRSVWDLAEALGPVVAGNVPSVPEEEFRRLLRGDKKRTNEGSLRFVFPTEDGYPIIETTSEDAVVGEARGWGFVS